MCDSRTDVLFPSSSFVKYSLQQSQQYLKQRPITETDIDDQVIPSSHHGHYIMFNNGIIIFMKMSSYSNLINSVCMTSWFQISQQRGELLKRQEAAADEARAVSRGVEGG